MRAMMAIALLCLGIMSKPVAAQGPVDAGTRAELERARDVVWRSWFAGDSQTLDRVLAGASGILPDVAGLHLELSLVPLYADQKLFAEMTALARSLGFEPWAIWPTFFDPGTGRLLQVDATFFRPE